MPERVVAIVPAAGSGTRFGSGKTFAELAGRPMLAWTLGALESCHEIAEIIPVLRQEDMAKGERLVGRFGLRKVRAFAVGGKERQDSVMNGLKMATDPSCLVLVHDGARPLVTYEVVCRVIRALEGHNGSAAALPPKDTIKEAGPDGVVARTLPRPGLWAVQTPQVFPFSVIMDAYLAASRDACLSTDDSALVERIGGRVMLVEGSYDNIKITTPEDAVFAEAVLNRRASP